MVALGNQTNNSFDFSGTVRDRGDYYEFLFVFIGPFLVSLLFLLGLWSVNLLREKESFFLEDTMFTKTGWTRYKAWSDFHMKVVLVYMLGPLMFVQTAILSQTAHSLPSPTSAQAELCGSIQEGASCFVTWYAHADATIFSIDFDPEADDEPEEDNPLEALRSEYTYMELKCAEDGETLLLPAIDFDGTTESTPLDWDNYQIMADCFAYQPQTASNWMEAIGIATGGIGALQWMFSNIDGFCHIGEPEAKSCTTRFYRLTVAWMLILFAPIVWAACILAPYFTELRGLPKPNAAEIATASVVGLYFIICGVYVDRYERQINKKDPWKKLDALFGTVLGSDGFAGVKQVDGEDVLVWTKKSTEQLVEAYYRVRVDGAPANSGLPATFAPGLEDYSGKGLREYLDKNRKNNNYSTLLNQTQRAHDSCCRGLCGLRCNDSTVKDEWKSYRQARDLLIFIAAVKQIPSRVHEPYANGREKAGFTVEEIWNATWDKVAFGYDFGAPDPFYTPQPTTFYTT